MMTQGVGSQIISLATAVFLSDSANVVLREEGE